MGLLEKPPLLPGARFVSCPVTVTAVGRATGEGTGGGVPAFWGSAGSIMAVPSAPIITPTPNATTTRSWLFLGGLEITTSGIAPYIVRMVMNL